MRDVFLFSRVSALFTVIGLLSPLSTHASDLAPRAEVSVKGGSERSMLTTEFWAPLAQKSDRVVYTDLRLMGDDDDNREGNLGIGYRQVYAPTNSVLGIHGWIDRRRTEHNSTFHQATFGVESLGDKLDLRANGYIPLNGSHTVTTPNLGSATPYLAGNGLFFDTNGSVSETPQYGLDAEAGYRLPICESQIDAVRIYGGSYYFFRDNTESVLGGRARIEAQINQLVSVGARFQYDAPRGSQGFLEATLRFPFSAKKLYQKSGLVSRLDESPERDIDIVTSAKIDTGLHKEVLNTSGTQQRILYVDNTQSNGDGTKEHPFNNLQSAQQALQANDILYIFRGDGTTHNMDQGITISQPGVQLIGSGSSLTISGYTFLNAGDAPVITNTQATIDETTGNGIDIRADNTYITGITVSGATRNGIYALSDGAYWHNFTVQNITASNNLLTGIKVTLPNNATVENILIDHNNLSTNAEGLRVLSSGFINQISVTNNIAANNGQITTPLAHNGHGILISAIQNQIHNILIENNNVSNSFSENIAFTADNASSVINSAIVRNNNSQNGNGYGYYVSGRNQSNIKNALFENNVDNGSFIGFYTNTRTGGNIETITYNNNITTNNLGSTGARGFSTFIQTAGIIDHYIMTNNTVTGAYIGAFFQTTDSGSGINSITIDKLNASNNSNTGLNYVVQAGSYINESVISNVTAINNAARGIYFNGNGGTFGSLTLRDSVMTNNVSDNLRIDANIGGSVIGQISVSNVITNNSTSSEGILLSASAGGIIQNVTLSNITSRNNALYGLYIAANSGTINQANLSNLSLNNNVSNGLYINAQTATAVIDNLSVKNSDITGNAGYGIALNKSATTSVLNADLGGGGLSTGGNRIFGNTTNDLTISRAVVTAGSNWWNNGGAAPTRVTLSNGGSATYTPPLATDPRP